MQRLGAVPARPAPFTLAAGGRDARGEPRGAAPLHREAAVAWRAYAHAVAVGAKPWDLLRLRHAWERLVVRAALAELAGDGDREAARRLEIEERAAREQEG